MPVYIARWDDGTSQIVSAPNRTELMSVLDETGSPPAAQIISTGDACLSIDVSKPTLEVDDLHFSIKFAFCDSGANLAYQLARGFPNLLALTDRHQVEETVPPQEWFDTALAEDMQTELKGFKRGTIPRYGEPDDDDHPVPV